MSSGGAPLPIPIQKAAARLYNDTDNTLKNCEHYDKNFEIAYKYLKPFFPNLKIPPGGFYLWLPVKKDILVTNMKQI